MSQMKKRNGSVRRCRFIIYLLIGIIMLLFWPFVMWILSKKFFLISDKAIWIQLISSYILAVPSIFICAYAAYLTKKYAELDAERLRPELLLRTAKISICMVNRAKLDQCLRASEDRWDDILLYQNDKGNQSSMPNVGYLSLAADIRLHSGESVREITIQEIEVHIGGEAFTMEYGAPAGDARFAFLTRNYIDGCEEYHIEFQPEYKDLPDRKEHFGNLMKNAIVASEYDDTKRAMEWHIQMGIIYGINQTRAKEKSVHAECILQWDRTIETSVNENTFSRKARGGMVSICLK